MAELATRIAELQRVVTAQQTEIQSLRQQQERPGPSPGRGIPQQPDTRLGQPPVFVGDESAFDNWSFKLKAYIGNQSSATLDLMRNAESLQDPLDHHQYDADTAALSTSLYYKVSMLTDRAALAIVRQVTSNDGFEAYRRLVARYNPRTMGRGLSRLAHLLSFDFGSDESQLLDKILQWERLIDEYEHGGSDKVSDSTRCAVMQSRAPAAVRTHLLLNAPTTPDWPAMRRTIQNYVIASSATAVPMEIGAVGKFSGKGKGKGKFQKGKWETSWDYGSKKGGKGGGEAQRQKGRTQRARDMARLAVSQRNSPDSAAGVARKAISRKIVGRKSWGQLRHTAKTHQTPSGTRATKVDGGTLLGGENRQRSAPRLELSPPSLRKRAQVTAQRTDGF